MAKRTLRRRDDDPGEDVDEQLYINGAWIAPEGGGRIEVINPATEQIAGYIARGTAADVAKAVTAAQIAGQSAWRRTSWQRPRTAAPRDRRCH